jgi:4-amino-4-deoxy-L-arabinose transferase-like glycosyltransferase
MPLASVLAPHKSSGTSYLAWQLTRRSNHAATFYLSVVPAAIGWAVVALAALAIILNRRNRTWRELLLITWALVPLAAFELYPLKGFQYLLPIAPAIAVLAARGLSILPGPRWFDSRAWGEFRSIIGAVVVLSLLPGLWNVMFPGGFHASLAGSGGLPGGRDAGDWIASHVAQGSEIMTIGPSMANVLEYYGHRPALGLSVSTNPLHRNPAYTPIPNPDRAIRDGQFAFLVWDAYSAHRSPYSATRLARLLERYHAQPVLTETVGHAHPRPVVIIYEVHP